MADGHQDPPGAPPALDLWRTVRDAPRLPGPLGRRGDWFIRLRWFVAPAMLVGTLVARALGFEFSVVGVLAVAAATLLYNVGFHRFAALHHERLRQDPRAEATFLVLQVVADYAAMFALLYFTGGALSPLAVFLVFHVILAAIQFPRGLATHLYAGAAGAGLWLLWLAESFSWIRLAPLRFAGEPLYAPVGAVAGSLTVGSFTVLLFLAAYLVDRIMARLREQVADLARVNQRLTLSDQRQLGVYAMIRAIGAERNPDRVLHTVVTQLAEVLEVPAVAIRLVEEDGAVLRCVAAHGLPPEWTDRAVRVADRALDRRVLADCGRVDGRIEDEEAYEIRRDLAALDIRKFALVGLALEDRIIGTLDVYSAMDEPFVEEDLALLERTANLAAIAIEHARAAEEIEALMEERTKFTLEVAHNLRAPLGAGLGMLELLDDRSLGELNEGQADLVRRIESRLRSLHRMVGDLLTIGRSRDWSQEIPDVVIDLDALVAKVRETFRAEAMSKKIDFRVEAEADLPAIDSGADLLERIFDNLVSNAIKYTPEGGEVEVRVHRHAEGEVRIVVRDTGIGIPSVEQERLFREFFRATNAKQWTGDGTGLGLTLVKKAVERHAGRLRLASEEGEGTTVVVDLPIRQVRRTATMPP